MAEFVTSVLNTNVHTFGVAPVFATVERACIQGMAKQIGFNPELADGILCPGGTFANISAGMVARHAAFPHVKVDGWAPEDRPVMFTSKQVRS